MTTDDIQVNKSVRHFRQILLWRLLVQIAHFSA